MVKHDTASSERSIAWEDLEGLWFLQETRSACLLVVEGTGSTLRKIWRIPGFEEKANIQRVSVNCISK